MAKGGKGGYIYRTSRKVFMSLMPSMLQPAEPRITCTLLLGSVYTGPHAGGPHTDAGLFPHLQGSIARQGGICCSRTRIYFLCISSCYFTFFSF